MCSRIARAFLLSSSRQPHNQNHNRSKNRSIIDPKSNRPDLESKVDHESSGQMGFRDPNMHALGS